MCKQKSCFESGMSDAFPVMVSVRFYILLWTAVSYVAQAPHPAAPQRRVSQVEEERKKLEVQLSAPTWITLDIPHVLTT